MNLNHLGDAFDFWKGGILEPLNCNLNNLHVLPMFTDENVPCTWTEDHLQHYAQLLRIHDIERILKKEVPFNRTGRGDYFQDVNGELDLFIDPDIGIEPQSGGDVKHIKLEELAMLLRKNPQRVLLVYQHSNPKKDWLEDVLVRVRDSRPLNGCECFAYQAGRVAMIFISSRANERLSAIWQALSISLPGNRLVSP